MKIYQGKELKLGEFHNYDQYSQKKDKYCIHYNELISHPENVTMKNSVHWLYSRKDTAENNSAGLKPRNFAKI